MLHTTSTKRGKAYNKETAMKTNKVKIISLLATTILAAMLFPANAAAKYDTGAGNCLSLPVIWSEGVTKILRGVYGEPVFNGASFPVTDENGDTVVWYLQQDEANVWQAESASSNQPLDITSIDWGDNLEAHPWTIRSIVRTEITLYQDITNDPMLAFEMAHLWGEGTTEMWATNGITYPSNEATVYSTLARFTIQKLTVVPYDEAGLPIDNGTLGLAWDATQGQWSGPVAKTLYNSAVWEAEGVTGKALASIYSAEINIPGKVIYGYNWNLRKNNDGVGFYRLTFSLDAVGGQYGNIYCNTFMTQGITSVRTSENVSGGGIGMIDYSNNLTYIDVEITSK